MGTDNIVECRLFENDSEPGFILMPYEVTGRDLGRREVRLPGAREEEDSEGAMVLGMSDVT